MYKIFRVAQVKSELQNSQDSIHLKECIELSGSMADGPSIP